MSIRSPRGGSRGGLPAGQQRERDIVELLRTSGFRAQANSGAAKPRQTDVYAQGSDLDLLVEVKDRKRRIDVSDIDSLRARLHRTTADVVGAIFSTSALTRTAIKEIEADRSREIIVFVEAEIERLLSGKARLSNLIARKREELRIHGRVWVQGDATGQYVDARLPKSTLKFLSGSTTGNYFYSRTDFAHALLTMSVPDSGWGNPGGEGARLSLRLELSSSNDLRDLFGYLHDRFGLSTNGAFSIHQSGASWHGAGVASFLNAANEYPKRYKDALMERVHHSEDLVYFDEFRGGWLSLYTRQRVPDLPGTKECSYFHSSELCIQLPGIPVDVAPFLDLCRYTGNELADFKYIHERHTRTCRLKNPIKLQVVGNVLQTDESREGHSWIVGLISRNPFYKKECLPKELEESRLPDIREFELLLCDVRDHLEFGDVVDYYTLEGVETTDSDHVQIMRPFGTWNKITSRATPLAKRKQDMLRDLRRVASEQDSSTTARIGPSSRKKSTK
jgi:hypothetical protein